jgi:hypothetical protein
MKRKQKFDVINALSIIGVIIGTLIVIIYKDKVSHQTYITNTDIFNMSITSIGFAIMGVSIYGLHVANKLKK